MVRFFHHSLYPSYFLFVLLLLGHSCARENPPVAAPEPTVPFSPQAPGNSTALLIIEDEVFGVPVVLLGKATTVSPTGLNEDQDNQSQFEEWTFVTAFQQELEGARLQFSQVAEEERILLEDQMGNRWDLFGKALSGPWQGKSLRPVNAGIGYWFAFAAMYPGLAIHPEPPPAPVRVSEPPAANWLIPLETVVDAAGQDGIPSINKPLFYEHNNGQPPPVTEDIVRPGDLVLVLQDEGITKAYPYPILDYHEIVNDQIGSLPVTVTYCPLTGTAKVWDRSQFPADDFGVSGLLYNSNLMPFDRRTESLWHQLEGWCLYGPRRSERLPVVPHLEMTWANFRQRFPKAQVLSANTGFDRLYTVYPYGDYRENQAAILFPLAHRDDRLAAKERVFAVIIEGRAKVYRAASFL